MILAKYFNHLIRPMLPISQGIAPLVLPAIAAGMGLIDPLSKLLAGIKQKKMAKNLKKSNYIPEGLTTALSEGRQGAYSARGLDQGVEEAMLRKQQAGELYAGKQAAGSSAQKLAFASNVGGNFTDRMRQLQAQGRAGQHGRRQNYQNLLMGKANVELQNQRAYEGEKAALTGASMQNIHGFWLGLEGAAGDVLGTIAKYQSGNEIPNMPGAEAENMEGMQRGSNVAIPEPGGIPPPIMGMGAKKRQPLYQRGW